MPPLLDDELPDGTVERTVTVGLHPADGRRAGTRSSASRLGPARSSASRTARRRARARPRRRCGLPDARQHTTTGRAGRGAHHRDAGTGEALWRLIAVRPAASSGTDGSGVELRNVAYRGKRVLRRAHVPILNVRYDGDACGPYRDWQNEESRFHADGDDVGARLPALPHTGDDDPRVRQGPAATSRASRSSWTARRSMTRQRAARPAGTATSAAWRLHADGTIRARFGFGAVENRACASVHHHHAYWRLRLRHRGRGRRRRCSSTTTRRCRASPATGTPCATRSAASATRAASGAGACKQPGSGEGYVLTPGANDGEADSATASATSGRCATAPARSTTAAVAGGHPRRTSTRFVNGESIVGTDVVVWYAGALLPRRRPSARDRRRRTSSARRSGQTAGDRRAARRPGGRVRRLDAFVDGVGDGPSGFLLEGEDRHRQDRAVVEAALAAAAAGGLRVLECRPTESEAELAYAALGDLLVTVPEAALAGAAAAPAPRARRGAHAGRARRARAALPARGRPRVAGRRARAGRARGWCSSPSTTSSGSTSPPRRVAGVRDPAFAD